MLSRKISNFSLKSPGDALGLALRDGVGATEGASHASFVVDSIIKEDGGWHVIVTVVWEPQIGMAGYADKKLTPASKRGGYQQKAESEELMRESAKDRKKSSENIEEGQIAAYKEHERENEESRERQREEVNDKLHEIVEEEGIVFISKLIDLGQSTAHAHGLHNLVIESKHEDALREALSSDQNTFSVHVVPADSMKAEAERHPIDIELHEATTAAKTGTEQKLPKEKPSPKAGLEELILKQSA
ncbi:MAG TPA: hypothetical protein PKI93_01540 [Alphaproteobacteria bacterium]|nr:hypothetical protein [Alphaproteobacteria bacterium]